MAGETVDTAVAAVRDLNASGITASLDLLGESVARASEADHARDEYLGMLDRIAATAVQANVSVKLTQMGLDISPDVCRANMHAILNKAKALDSFVRLDMEGSAYTDRTLSFFYDQLHPDYGAHCGVVIQSMLRRSPADIEKLIRLQARVRICKGAYLESPEVAFPDKKDVDAQYVALMERLMVDGNYPGVATHDEAIIEHAKSFARAKGIAPERFEFQMLYGVRRDLQLRLRQEGWK
ncbi:MAG: proline dehydrogenase family protein, partial [Gemmatimonadales bacterium]